MHATFSCAVTKLDLDFGLDFDLDFGLGSSWRRFRRPASLLVVEAARYTARVSTRRHEHPPPWPRLTAALAAGLVAGGCVRGAPWLAPFALALATGAHAVCAFDTPLSRAWPRSQRPQWAARLSLVGSVVLAAPWEGAAPFAASLAGAGSGLLAREARTPARASDLAALSSGGALGAVASFVGGARAPAFVGLLGLIVSALLTFASVFRGGPGRTPVRPVDVVWLYALGALLALTLSLAR